MYGILGWRCTSNDSHPGHHCLFTLPCMYCIFTLPSKTALFSEKFTLPCNYSVIASNLCHVLYLHSVMYSIIPSNLNLPCTAYSHTSSLCTVPSNFLMNTLCCIMLFCILVKWSYVVEYCLCSMLRITFCNSVCSYIFTMNPVKSISAD